MARDKIRMPSSTAGITQYYDDYKSKIRFKAGHIIILIILIIIVMIIIESQFGF